MNYYESLERRVRVLEAYILEGKHDQEVLQNFLGDEYYNKYNAIKNKIKDPEYKDIYQLIKKDPDEVKNYIDSVQSNRDIRSASKSDGAKLIYDKDGWKVYRITTYKAAQLYGSGTRWCITGRYEGHEEQGEHYFNEYIEDNDLDGGYYFYIKGNKKYCLLRKKNGEIDSIWTASDEELDEHEILLDEKDFPSIEGLFVPEPIEYSLFTDSQRVLFDAYELGYDPNKRCINKDKPYYGFTPLEWAIDQNRWNIVTFLISFGAKSTGKEEWRSIMLYGYPSVLSALLRAGLKTNKNEMLEFAYWHSGVNFVEVMLKAGANPDMVLKNGDTILANEINRGSGARINLISTLIKHGANANISTKAGNDLLELAEMKCKSSIISVLKSARRI